MEVGCGEGVPPVGPAPSICSVSARHDPDRELPQALIALYRPQSGWVHLPFSL